MSAWRFLGSLALLSSVAAGQPSKAPAFEAASVKQSPRQVGPDYNNRITISPAGVTARNVTIRRLVSEAYRLQLRQVLGAGWLDQGEYDIEARAGGPVGREELESMLRTLLAERFNLKQHRETREMRVHELVADKSGPKIQPILEGEPVKSGEGVHFHGNMRQFADFLAVQFSFPPVDDPNQPVRAGGPATPVLDKTSLPGTYDFTVAIRPELGSDPFSLWQAALRSQLGLRIESRRREVEVLVIDSVSRIPVAN